MDKIRSDTQDSWPITSGHAFTDDTPIVWVWKSNEKLFVLLTCVVIHKNLFYFSVYIHYNFYRNINWGILFLPIRRNTKVIVVKKISTYFKTSDKTLSILMAAESAFLVQAMPISYSFKETAPRRHYCTCQNWHPTSPDVTRLRIMLYASKLRIRSGKHQ